MPSRGPGRPRAAARRRRRPPGCSRADRSPCATETRRIAPSMLACTTETMPRAASRPRPQRGGQAGDRLGRQSGGRHAAVEEVRRAQPPQHDVGVGDRGRDAAAAIAGRPGWAPALCGPTFSAPPESTQAMHPPPAPTVSISSVGMRTGIAGDRCARPRSPAGRRSTRATSVEVPPMSKVMIEANPAAARPRPRPSRPRSARTAASAPEVAGRGDGDDPAVGLIDVGRRRNAETPDLVAEAPEVAADQRAEVGVDTVVDSRSNSLNCGETSEDSATYRSRNRSRIWAATCRSCVGSRKL